MLNWNANALRCTRMCVWVPYSLSQFGQGQPNGCKTERTNRFHYSLHQPSSSLESTWTSVEQTEWETEQRRRRTNWNWIFINVYWHFPWPSRFIIFLLPFLLCHYPAVKCKGSTIESKTDPDWRLGEEEDRTPRGDAYSDSSICIIRLMMLIGAQGRLIGLRSLLLYILCILLLL